MTIDGTGDIGVVASAVKFGQAGNPIGFPGVVMTDDGMILSVFCQV